MKSPKHLSHKPLVSVNDYDKVDGMYRNNTDAKALSIGYAQYDNDEIAMKVWRHVNGHWSRQSEELPVKAKSQISEDQPSGYDIIKQYYQTNHKDLEPRLKELRELLNKMK